MLKKFSLFARSLFSNKKIFYPAKEVELAGRTYLARELSEDDVKELIALERDVYDGETPWTKSAFLSEIYSPIAHLYFCLEYQDELVAFAGCRIIGEDAHITNIAVKKKYQTGGLGSYMIDEIEKFAIINGCKQLSLEVRISNQDAQRLYRRVGFESYKVRKNYYTENKEDALEMLKKIG